MSFIGADQDWEDEIKKLRADLATERLEREQTQSVLDAERAEHEGVQAELLRTRSEAREQRDAERTARESSEKERDGLAAVLARVDDVIENWPNGDLDEDAAAMAKVEEIARGSDHAAILAAHNARLTAPLERRVEELERALRFRNRRHEIERAQSQEDYGPCDCLACVALASTPREGQREPEKQV